jgi:ribonuclease Z
MAGMTWASDFRVTLLGTGTPKPQADRFGPSTLIEAGGQKLLIDAGRGATIRLSQLGVPLGGIDALLLTHYHSDHTVGIPDLWLTGWLQSHYARRAAPFRFIGQTGAKKLMSHLEKAYALDIEIRVEDEKLSPEGAAIAVEEFDRDGVVYAAGGLEVTAFEVDHGAAIKPAFGYRIEYAGRTVVISGDTRYNENVVKYGADADLLIHEVAMARPELLSEDYIRRIMAHHTTAREAGMVFARTKPKLAAYTHLVFLAGDRTGPATVDDLIAATRQTYDGRLEVGEDLMSFEIGVTVQGLSTNKQANVRDLCFRCWHSRSGLRLSGSAVSLTKPGAFVGPATRTRFRARTARGP